MVADGRNSEWTNSFYLVAFVRLSWRACHFSIAIKKSNVGKNKKNTRLIVSFFPINIYQARITAWVFLSSLVSTGCANWLDQRVRSLCHWSWRFRSLAFHTLSKRNLPIEIMNHRADNVVSCLNRCRFNWHVHFVRDPISYWCRQIYKEGMRSSRCSFPCIQSGRLESTMNNTML